MHTIKHVIDLTASELGPLCPEALDLAQKLIHELKDQKGNLKPVEVTGAIIKVLSIHVASCRKRDQPPEVIATRLAATVFADYLSAHSYAATLEAKQEPGG